MGFKIGDRAIIIRADYQDFLIGTEVTILSGLSAWKIKLPGKKESFEAMAHEVEIHYKGNSFRKSANGNSLVFPATWLEELDERDPNIVSTWDNVIWKPPEL